MEHDDLRYKTAIGHARRIVDEAEEAANRVGVLPEGINKKLETLTAHGTIAEARGCLTALRIVYPDNKVLSNLWTRLNHCPVIMLVGPDVAKATQPQLVQ